MILGYGSRYGGLVLYWIAFGAVVYGLAGIDQGLLNQLQVSTVFIGMASRVPQIYQNFRAGSTGQLSIITYFLQFAGSLARVFTTFQEVSDVKILASFVSSTVLNGIIVVQILVLGGAKKNLKKKKKQ